MCVSEIRVKQTRDNQGLGVLLFQTFMNHNKNRRKTDAKKVHTVWTVNKVLDWIFISKIFFSRKSNVIEYSMTLRKSIQSKTSLKVRTVFSNIDI